MITREQVCNKELYVFVDKVVVLCGLKNNFIGDKCELWRH